MSWTPTCSECDDDALVLLAITEYESAEQNSLVSSPESLYCLYHFGHAHVEATVAECRRVRRIEFRTDALEKWQPYRPTIYSKGDPERELESLLSYLKACDDAVDDDELHGRRIGVEAALDIVQRHRQMGDIIDHWPEPWKQKQ